MSDTNNKRSMGKVETPHDIFNFTTEQVLNSIRKESNMPSVKARARFYQYMYDVLGFTLDNDILYALLQEPKSQLILATAGSGKTTFAQLKICGEKIYSLMTNPNNVLKGSEVLCLVYNKHNVPDVLRKQETMMARLKLSGIDGLDKIDSEVRSFTVHGFCNYWKDEYVAKLKLLGFDAIEDGGSATLMKRAVDIMIKKYNYVPKKQINYYSILSLYNFHKESMLDLEKLSQTDTFIDVGLPVDLIDVIFDRYDKNKTNKRVYDYTDLLQKVYTLLLEDKVVRERVQSFYKMIVADEYQDFTPLMSSILKLITATDTKLICIGDEDQSVYRFRGANINNILNFTNIFEDAKVFTLATNRRCPEVIFNESRKIIEENTLRFDKPLRCIKKGGEVNYVPYTTREGEALKIVDAISEMDILEQMKTYVCYRSKSSSSLITELLMEANIPLYITSGVKPLGHELYGHMFDVLNAIEMGTDIDQTINLYKVLPVTKADWFEDLGYNPEKKTFKSMVDNKGKDLNRLHFGNREYVKCSRTKGFSEAMSKLIKISKMINDEPMRSYFVYLFDQLGKYYWKFKKSINDDQSLDNFFEERVYKMFNSTRTYKEFYALYSTRKKKIEINQRESYGVCISTFHSLKGLEFNSGFVMDMDNDIFPNFASIDKKPYSAEVKLSLKESETNLYFVVLTRAKRLLNIYYSQINPSIYVQKALGNYSAPELKDVIDLTSDDLEFTVMNSFSSDMPDEMDLEKQSEEITKEMEDKYPTEFVTEKLNVLPLDELDDFDEIADLLNSAEDLEADTVTLETLDDFNKTKSSFNSQSKASLSPDTNLLKRKDFVNDVLGRL